MARREGQRWVPTEPDGWNYTDEEAELADTLNMIDLTVVTKRCKCKRPIPDYSALCWTCYKHSADYGRRNG